MDIWRVKVGDDVFTTDEPLPKAFAPAGVEGLVVRAIFQRGALVEQEIEIEEERTRVLKADGSEAGEGEDGDEVVTRKRASEFVMRETLPVAKTLVFVLPKKGTAWHPDQNAFKGHGRGMYLELTHATEEDTASPFVVRVGTYNETLRNMKAIRDNETAAFEAVKRLAASAASEEDEETPQPNGSGHPNGAAKTAEGNA